MENLQHKNVPQHVAIIMDGNGRWARERGLDRIQGHIAGVESVRKVIKAAVGAGIKYLTLYAFSTENWGRPKEETDALMRLLCESAVNESPKLKEQGIKLNFVGDMDSMPDDMRRAIAKSREETASGKVMTLTLAINYGSRREIAQMAKLVASEVKENKLSIREIDDDVVREYLITAALPDPDMLIRTGGELRLSNFLLWQAAYSELYFTGVYWPDFDGTEFGKALDEYAKRERRYGLLTKED